MLKLFQIIVASDAIEILPDNVDRKFIYDLSK